MAKIWVTKYALTRGIVVVNNAKIDGGHASWGPSHRVKSHAHIDDWHLTEEAARFRFEEMRKKAVAAAKLKANRLARMVPKFINE